MTKHAVNIGPLFALISAALFGFSPALTKLVMGNMSALLLAGLLYFNERLQELRTRYQKRAQLIRELNQARACFHNIRQLFLVLFSAIFEIFLGNIPDIPCEIFRKWQKKSLKKTTRRILSRPRDFFLII